MNRSADLESSLVEWMGGDETIRVRAHVVQAATQRARGLPQKRSGGWGGWRPTGPTIHFARIAGVAGFALVTVMGIQLAGGLQAQRQGGDASPTLLAPSPAVPAAPAPADITLGTGLDMTGLTGLATAFRLGDPIQAAVWRGGSFGSSPVMIGLSRTDRGDPVQVWDMAYPVEVGQTLLYFALPDLDPGSYRLIASLGPAQELASIDLQVVDGEPVAVRPTSPPLPEGWTMVESGGGDLRMALPPGVAAGDTMGAIFANEPPSPGETTWLELLAEGPRTTELQPGPGESLVAWLERRWLMSEQPRGPITTRVLHLPAGDAVELRTTFTGVGDELESVILTAIRAPDGIAFIVIDGPASTMERRASEIATLMRLIEIPPR